MKRLLPLLSLAALALFGLLCFVLLPASAAPPAKAPPKPITNSIGMKFAYIPPGKFLMGSTEAEQKEVMKLIKEHKEMLGAVAGEKEPEVELSRGFYLGVYEVTQKQYKEVMGKNPSYFRKDGGGKDKVKDMNTDDFPVDSVSWEDAQVFIKRLNALPEEKKNKRQYRLPSEAEWEYACRGGVKVKTTFHFGNSLSSKQANFHGEHPHGRAEKGKHLARTCKVGSYTPNAFGLYDMHGNVWEWCEDTYDEKYYSASPKRDPVNSKEGPYRVLRGGGCSTHGGLCRSADRGWFSPSVRDDHSGFRVALVPAR
jgi:formylglycine-generating enzyme required for sulfatase activity